MSARSNEAVKLLANALDRISTGCVVVGCIGVASSVFSQAGTSPNQVVTIAAWGGFALMLHFMAQSVVWSLYR